MLFCYLMPIKKFINLKIEEEKFDFGSIEIICQA